jgi:hypothetical protein
VKRGTPDHPKMRSLARTLGVCRAHAVGIMECLWHFTSNYAPDGSLAKFTLDEIAEAVTWTKGPERLIEALKQGWIDDDLFVHDWPAHCDDATHIKLARSGQTFACGCTPNVSRLNQKDRPNGLVRMVCARHARIVRASCAPPLPTPLPLPLPTPKQPCAVLKRETDEMAIEIYSLYPRKIARPAALKAIAKALTKTDVETLKRAVTAFATSCVGKDPQYIPHPATWFNNDRWTDQPDTFEKPDDREIGFPIKHSPAALIDWAEGLTDDPDAGTITAEQLEREARELMGEDSGESEVGVGDDVGEAGGDVSGDTPKDVGDKGPELPLST